MVDNQELSVSQVFESSAAPEVPNGWTALTSAFFSAITPDENLTNFFNGGEPQWEAVVNSKLLRIQLTDSLLDRTRRRIREKKTGIELLIGPTGEGKSTALRQAAAALAIDDSRTILWRERRDAVLDQNLIDAAHAYGPGTVLASDNAQLILEQLHELIMSGGIPSSSGLQLLLASRDTDWSRRARELGFRLNPADAWKSQGPIVSTKHPFGRVSESDARKIIHSWRALDPNLPDAIGELTDRDAAKLLSDATGSADSQSGALLGGLLAIRYTPDELRAHLVSLLESLSRDATQSDMTLADVVVILALADVAGIDGIPSEVIAGFCNIDEFSLRTEVANRLGDEAVANYGGDVLRSRHPMVSRAVFEIAMSNHSSLGVESAASRLLTIIAKDGGSTNLKDGYGQIFGLGRSLFKANVSPNLAPRSRLLGIALARRACELRPRSLANHMSLSECLRLENQSDRAFTTVWLPINEQLLTKKSWHDWNKNSRTAVNEFAITASLAGYELEATVLRMAALSDSFRADNGKFEEWLLGGAISGLALHLSRLYLIEGERWLADALADVHGFVIACFPDDTETIALTTKALDNAGIKSNSFETPAAFVLRLNDLMKRISSAGSDQIKIGLWRSTFTDLKALLDTWCGHSA